MSAEELEAVRNTDRNLQASGKAGDSYSYTLTINGRDVERTEDFSYSIRAKDMCSHAEDIQALAVNPLILCMEDMEAFPGTLLVSLQTDLDDGQTLLFRYDSKNRQAEYVKKVTVEDGTAAFTLAEGGDYFLAERALAGSLNDAGTADEQAVIREEAKETGADVQVGTPEEITVLGTGDTGGIPFWATSLILGAGTAAAAVIAAVAILHRKRKGQKR